MTSEYECPIAGCDESYEKKRSRNVHMGRYHSEHEKREAYVDELQRLADEHELVTEDLMTEQGKFSHVSAFRLFGSWNDAMRAAGIGVNSFRDSVSGEGVLEQAVEPGSVWIDSGGGAGDSLFYVDSIAINENGETQVSIRYADGQTLAVDRRTFITRAKEGEIEATAVEDADTHGDTDD